MFGKNAAVLPMFGKNLPFCQGLAKRERTRVRPWRGRSVNKGGRGEWRSHGPPRFPRSEESFLLAEPPFSPFAPPGGRPLLPEGAFSCEITEKSLHFRSVFPCSRARNLPQNSPFSVISHPFFRNLAPPPAPPCGTDAGNPAGGRRELLKRRRRKPSSQGKAAATMRRDAKRGRRRSITKCEMTGKREPRSAR